MTPELINQLIAVWRGEADLYAVMKGDYYYRPGAHGYTDRIEDAWHLPKVEAEKQLVRGEPMRIVQVPFKNYHGSLDVVRDAELKLDPHQRQIYARLLHPKYRICALLDDFAVATTPAPQRCEALLKTLNLWREE